jgi:hypothetical protein
VSLSCSGKVFCQIHKASLYGFKVLCFSIFKIRIVLSHELVMTVNFVGQMVGSLSVVIVGVKTLGMPGRFTWII